MDYVEVPITADYGRREVVMITAGRPGKQTLLSHRQDGSTIRWEGLELAATDGYSISCRASMDGGTNWPGATVLWNGRGSAITASIVDAGGATIVERSETYPWSTVGGLGALGTQWGALGEYSYRGGKIEMDVVQAWSIKLPKDTKITEGTVQAVDNRCDVTVVDKNGTNKYTLGLKVVGTFTVPQLKNVLLAASPSTLDFGYIPLGGGAVRGLTITTTADMPYAGTIRFVADSAHGDTAPIGGAELRVRARSLSSNYLDLSGATEYQVRGTGGGLTDYYRADVFIDAGRGGQLGVHRTNLRVSLKYM